MVFTGALGTSSLPHADYLSATGFHLGFLYFFRWLLDAHLYAGIFRQLFNASCNLSVIFPLLWLQWLGLKETIV
jgi:hypothetical protein